MSFNEIAKLLVSIEASVNQALQGIDQITQKTSEAETRFSSLGQAASVAGGIIIAQFARATSQAVTTAFNASTQAVMGFEQGLAAIQMASLGTTDDLEGMIATVREAAEAAGVEFGTGATAAINAMLALVKAGMETDQAITALNSVLALSTIEQMNTATASNLVVQSLTQFGLSADDATRVVDNFVAASTMGIDTASGYAAGLANVGAQAAMMGFDIEETTAALVILDNTFGGAQESGTYLNMMLRELVTAADDLEISIYNADGSMKSMDDIVSQLRVKVEGFGNDQQKVNEYLEVLNVRSAKAVMGLINFDGTVAGIASKLGDQATAQDQVNIMLDTFTGKQNLARAEMENANIASGKLTAGIKTTWMEFAASIGPLGTFANALGPSMVQGAMSGLTVVGIPALIKALGAGGLSGAFSSVGGMLPGIGGLIGMAGPVGIGILALGAGVATFALAWKNNWFGIRDHVSNMATAIKGVVNGISTHLKNFWNWLTGSWKKGVDSTVSAAASKADAKADEMAADLARAQRYAEQLAQAARIQQQYAASGYTAYEKKKQASRPAPSPTTSPKPTPAPAPTPSRGGGRTVRRQYGGLDVFTEPALVSVAEAGPELHAWVPLTGAVKRAIRGGPSIGAMSFTLNFPNVSSIPDSPEAQRRLVAMLGEAVVDLLYARGVRPT